MNMAFSPFILDPFSFILEPRSSNLVKLNKPNQSTQSAISNEP